MTPKEKSFKYPLYPEIGVAGLVPDDWDTMWQPRHYVLTRLSKYFHVLYMNPPGSWATSIKRIPRSLYEPATVSVGREVPSSFVVYSPEPWLPVVYRPRWFGEKLDQLRLQRAKEILRKRGCKKVVLYIWRPEFASALHLCDWDRTLYHIDDEYTFSSVEQPIPAKEEHLIKSVDQVIVHSSGLLEKKGRINSHTTFIPNGVDYDAYARTYEEPEDLASIPQPRIGYTGHLKRQLDWSLLKTLIERHLSWSFVFVGAVNSHPDVKETIKRMRQYSNAYFLGAKSVDQLARYPQHFDVCIMPYKLDDYTKYIYPMKLHEYLATGRPVVASPILSLQEFAQVLSLAKTSLEWSQMLAECLKPQAQGLELVQARQAVARRHEWSVLVHKIAQIVGESLGLAFDDRKDQETIMSRSDAPCPSFESVVT